MKRPRAGAIVASCACAGALLGSVVEVAGSHAGGSSAGAPGVIVHRQGSPRASSSRRRSNRVVVVRGRTGARGPVGPRGAAGATGASGPAGVPGPNVAQSLTVNWSSLAASAGNDTSTATLLGIGTLTVVCNAGAQQLTLTPADPSVRTVADLTTFQGEGVAGISSNQRLESEAGAPLTIAIPGNGMLTGTLSVEPIAGNGGAGPAPASLILSSQFKLNDPDPAQNYCYVAAQAVQ